MKYGVYVAMFVVGLGYALIKTWQTSASPWMKILWTLNILVMPIASLVSDLLAKQPDENSPIV